MSKARVIIVIGFALAVGAGLVMGLLMRRSPLPPSREPWLVRELNLDAKQAEQMRQIWSGVMREAGRDQRDQEEQRRAVRKARDEAVQALLTAEQKEQYEAIQRRYQEQMAALGEHRAKAFAEAVERTRGILNEEQRGKYEELLKARRGERGERGDGHRPPRRPEERSTSGPATRSTTGPAVRPQADWP